MYLENAWAEAQQNIQLIPCAVELITTISYHESVLCSKNKCICTHSIEETNRSVAVSYIWAVCWELQELFNLQVLSTRISLLRSV